MKRKTAHGLKRVLSGALACIIASTLFTAMPVIAEEAPKYPYAIFADDEQTGITVNSNSFTLNGSAFTEGYFSTAAQYPNINGIVNYGKHDDDTTEDETTEEVFDVSTDMILIHNKLTNTYFTQNCLTFDEDYSLSEMNINTNNAIYVTGKLNLDGNIGLNNAVGAVSDVTLSGGNLNGNNTVIYSKFGDIDITNSQANVNGLIYAPFGTVTIDSDSFSMNGIIIAQNIEITAENVNINYSDSVAQIVGVESEELSWTIDDWKYLADTDDDGLPNLIEKEYTGTDQYDPDTDGDGLPDGYELFTLGTDPTMADTDENGVSDGDEDFDEDGLSNLKEYELGTDPFNKDTDRDGLTDGDEVNIYGTDPLKADTDEDGLDDGDEIYFETDPSKPDTDGNGILDGDEKRDQTFVHEVENEDCAVEEIIVSMEGTGNLQKTTAVESVMNRDILCTDVVGLVGEPFEITTESKFDKATITFKVDTSKLGETEFDNLLFLWYDEENDVFVELDTNHDSKNSSVSVVTTHFSKYMLVDLNDWYEAWSKKVVAYLYAEQDTEQKTKPMYDVLFGINCSSDGTSNDPFYIDDDGNAHCTRLDIAYELFDAVIDNTCVYSAFGIDTSYITACGIEMFGKTRFFNNISDDLSYDGPMILSYMMYYLAKWSVVHTSMAPIRQPGDERLAIEIMIISDDYDSTSVTDWGFKGYDDYLQECECPIYIIDLRGTNDPILRTIANTTGGEYLANTEENINYLKGLISQRTVITSVVENSKIIPPSEIKDTDKDGFYDEQETTGIRIQNGRMITIDPENDDTDYDALADGVEIDTELQYKDSPVINTSTGETIQVAGYYYIMHSDPTNGDYDDDGYNDVSDPDPSFYEDYSFLDKEIYYICGAIPYCNSSFLRADNQGKNEGDKIIGCGADGLEYGKFQFEWTDRGYLIHAVLNYELVLTVNTDNSSLSLQEFNSQPGQYWEITPYGEDVYGYEQKGIKIRSKQLKGGNSLYLSVYNDDVSVTDNSADYGCFTVESLSSSWYRFGQIYMEYLGWTGNLNPNIDRAIENYKYNSRIGLSEENLQESDGGITAVIFQDGGNFPKLKFADVYMDGVICEVMATYNAMCFSNGNNDDVDFFKLSAEFEISGIRHNMFAWLPDSILDNSDEAYLVTREGGFGSDPLKIKNCLISYDKQFYEIYVDYKYAFTDASPLKKKHSENCEGLQNMCINGKGTIVSYVFDKVKIHTFAVEYDTGEKLPLTTYNRRNDEEAKMSYGSIEEAIGADRYYLSGYVLF